MKFIYRLLGLMLISSIVQTPVMAGLEDDVLLMQKEWEKIKYSMPATSQEQAFNQLVKQADALLAKNKSSAEILIWHAIIEASYAGAKGGIGALGHVKNAKKDLEQALIINPQALDGSAYTSLGSLYYQVPGWPIGFGDDKKAAELLNKALSINPNGIDSNYFMGDFYFRNGDFSNAEKFLKKALQAPNRPNRTLADEGRRQEINTILDKIAQKRKL